MGQGTDATLLGFPRSRPGTHPLDELSSSADNLTPSSPAGPRPSGSSAIYLQALLCLGPESRMIALFQCLLLTLGAECGTSGSACLLQTVPLRLAP